MTEDDENETIKCTVSCPECGAEMICTHEDSKHEEKHRCEKGQVPFVERFPFLAVPRVIQRFH